MGMVDISLPPRVLLNLCHSCGEGQQESPGKQRQNRGVDAWLDVVRDRDMPVMVRKRGKSAISVNKFIFEFLSYLCRRTMCSEYRYRYRYGNDQSVSF